MTLLKQYGLTDRFKNEATLYKGLQIGRVIAQYKGLYKIVTDKEERLAELSGKIRHEKCDLANLPAVGDYVMVKDSLDQKRAIIYYTLSRKSCFTRKAVGVNKQAQVIAANIDILFICISLNNNYNLNRLERYLSIAWDSGATPVIILTKVDLCDDIEDILLEVEKVSSFSDVIATSMYDAIGLEKVKSYLKNDVTAAFVGSSGVGKSTLINNILGERILETREIGVADKGKHATTRRELFPCPSGGVLMDTPGMRELGVDSAELAMTFPEIEDLAFNCKFSNCTHTTEPGCAVIKALDEGIVDRRRLDNYFKLKTEAEYEGLNSKEIENIKLDRMFKDVGGMKKARKSIKNKK